MPLAFSHSELPHSELVGASQLRQAGGSKPAVVSFPIPLGEVHADLITFFCDSTIRFIGLGKLKPPTAASMHATPG